MSDALDRPHKRLTAARNAAGYGSPKAFYTKHKIEQSTYTGHESGRRGLKKEVAEHYAALLRPKLHDITAEWLLFGSGEPPLGTIPPRERTRDRGAKMRETQPAITGQPRSGASKIQDGPMASPDEIETLAADLTPVAEAVDGYLDREGVVLPPGKRMAVYVALFETVTDDERRGLVEIDMERYRHLIRLAS